MIDGETAALTMFSEEYYRRVIRDFGYDTFELRRFDFCLAGMGMVELNARYLCHHHGEAFLATPVERRIVTTGFGMSGPPHMGTASQVMKMVQLQRGGERCQIVLGDLDAYNGRNQPFAMARECAERFGVFVDRLGFDSVSGTVRDQAGHEPALSAMYLLGRYAEDHDFDTAEEDNHAYYASQGIVDPSMTFRRKLSLALMAADFIALGQEYDAVLVLLGVDEHRYVRFAQQVAARFDGGTPLRADFALGALYTRLTRGFNGYPEFSKSLPGSAISVETPHDEIARLVMTDQADCPEESATYQLMCQMAYCPYEDLLRLHRECAVRTPAWETEKSQFVGYLLYVKSLWPQ